MQGVWLDRMGVEPHKVLDHRDELNLPVGRRLKQALMRCDEQQGWIFLINGKVVNVRVARQFGNPQRLGCSWAWGRSNCRRSERSYRQQCLPARYELLYSS